MRAILFFLRAKTQSRKGVAVISRPPLWTGRFIFFLAKHACRRQVIGTYFNVEFPTPIEEERLGKIRAKHYSATYKIHVGIGTNQKTPTVLLLREPVVYLFLGTQRY